MMDDQTKAEVAVGRWELWKQSRFMPETLERCIRTLAGKVMIGFFSLPRESAVSLTGEQMLFRTQLMIALAENEEVRKLLETIK